jgi:hypothetical protein
VVVSRTLQREVLARAVIVGRARPATGRRVRHTAQIRRLGRFTDWTPPPVISERRTGRTERFRLVHRRLLPRRRHWRYLVFVPVVAALAAALLFGVM